MTMSSLTLGTVASCDTNFCVDRIASRRGTKWYIKDRMKDVAKDIVEPIYKETRKIYVQTQNPQGL